MKLELSVPTMVCQVCADNITKVIAGIDQEAKTVIQLESKQIIIDTQKSLSEVKNAIVEIGHEVD